jgi:hypothetical protein
MTKHRDMTWARKERPPRSRPTVVAVPHTIRAAEAIAGPPAHRGVRLLACRRYPGWCGTWWNVSLEALETRGKHEECCRGTDVPVEAVRPVENAPEPLEELLPEVASLACTLGKLTGQLNRGPRFR